MSKKNKTTQLPQLSPENYIRQKARKLPVYECLVNSEWEKSKMVTVIVARVHANGNITAGIYLVDLFCLGIKDTTYLFNSPLSEYKNKIFKMENLQPIQVSYELAHNIVFSGLDYATELGLNPRKEFTSLTSYILEEDNEDIDLIEIECGRNGKPFYLQGQYDSDQMVKQVDRQLERAVGKGNYDIIRTSEAGKHSDKYNNQSIEDEHNEFRDMTYEEKKDLFLELLKSMEGKNKGNHEKLSDLVISVFNELLNDNLVHDQFKRYSKNLAVDLLPINEIPFELWGIEPSKQIITDKITVLFVEAYNMVNENTKKASKKTNKLKKIVGDIPIVRLLELMILQREGKEEKSIQMILDNQATFPDYPIFKIQLLLIKIEGFSIPEKLRNTIPGIQELFGDRTSLHEIEFMNYILALIALIENEGNAEKLEALQWAIEELELPSSLDATVYNEIMAIKFKLVIAYFS